MDLYVRGIRRISELCGVIAAALIALGVVIVCQMVFTRYVLNHNTIWQTDFVTYCLVAATFVGSPYVLLTRGHVNVDVLPQYLGARPRWWLALFSILMSLGFCLAITVLTARFWLESWDNRWVSDTMWRARLWIPYSAMPIGLGILALQYIADLYALVTGREPPFGIKA
ncbi:MAG TPA: TRAP transporter small permease [Burkholderiales bacterium]|nr:TRAP transporter small permease [Burkholderiales bacterium]